MTLLDARPGDLLTGAVQVVDDGNPLPEEQEMLELINRARRDPAAEAVRLKIDLNEGLAPGTITTTPKAPLATNAILLQVSRGHAQDMIDRKYFAHVDPSNLTPPQRIQMGGYAYTYWAENIAWWGNVGPVDLAGYVRIMHDMLFVDAGYPQRSHRTDILSEVQREIGTGTKQGPYTLNGKTLNSAVHTSDFGERDVQPLFLLGVVYKDMNADGLYQTGEGLGGVTLSLGSIPYTTRGAGGYAFALKSGGDFTLTCGSGAVGQGYSKTIHVDKISKKVDCLAGTGLKEF